MRQASMLQATPRAMSSLWRSLSQKARRRPLRSTRLSCAVMDSAIEMIAVACFPASGNPLGAGRSIRRSSEKSDLRFGYHQPQYGSDGAKSGDAKGKP